MRKTIAMMLSLVLVMSAVMCGGVANADDVLTETVAKNSAFLLTNSNATYDNTIQVSNDRRSYITFDFSGYEARLYAATGITISASALYASSNLINNIEFYAIDDDKEGYVKTPLGWEEARGYGILVDGTSVAKRTETTAVSTITLNMDAQAVKKALSSGSNSILILRAQQSAWSSHNAQINPSSVQINFEYPADYVSALAEGMQWSEISNQQIDAVTEKLSLPAKYKGCDVVWASSNTAALESDGTIHITSSSQSATLTATLSADGSSAEKAFNVTIPEKSLPSSEVAMTGGCFINYSSTSTSYWGQMQFERDRRSFALFDLKGHEAELYGATGIKISGSRLSNDSWNHLYSFSVYALDENAEQYINNSTTYSNSAKYIWDGGFLLAQRTDDADTANFDIDVDKSMLIKAFESGTDGVVAIRIQPIGDTTKGNSLLKTDLKLTFTYDDESEEYKNYLQTRVNNLLWSSISQQSQSRIYKNIALPSTLDENSISWISDNESIIKSNGEVINGNTLQTTTLTAKVGEYSKAFELVITPEFYVDTPSVEVEEETAEVVFASYNATDSAKNYVAIIAVYENEELKSIYVEDIESIADEATIEPFTITGVCSRYKVKAFSWNNTQDAKPLCDNAE